MRAALFLTAVLFAVPAQAQVIDTASTRLELLGDAPAACVLGVPTAGTASNASLAVTGATSARINITQLVDATSAASLPSSIELSLPVICNSAHRVVVRSGNGGLARVGSNQRGSGPFSEFLAYSFRLGWAGQQVDRGSDTGQLVLDASQPAKGDVLLRVVTPAGSGPLVAGQYNDTIVIEFQAAN